MTAHQPVSFSEATSVEAVTGRNAGCPDARLRAVVDVLVRKLHEAVREIEPTPDEWAEAIAFLTETGHMCGDGRQEYVLLSDILGVSMLVEAIAARRPTGATANSVLGPFHVAGAPEYPMGADISLDGKGEPLLVHGRVLDIDGRPIAGAKLDVWQAGAEGLYDVQQEGVQPAFNLRGRFATGADGRYRFRTVKPTSYPIPDDGPAGRLLRALGRHPYRPAHLHCIVEAQGCERLTTQIFDRADPYVDTDAVFGVAEGLLADFERVEDAERIAAAGFQGPYWEVAFDFVLAPELGR